MANRIPIIDLKKISSGNATPEDWQETADIMRGVLHEVGFMYLINHGIPSDVVADNFRINKEFFSLPTEIKQKYKRKSKENRSAWVVAGDKLRPDGTFEYREWFNNAAHEKVYPADVPDFETIHRKMERSCHTLIQNMLRLFALSLELDPEFFVKYCTHMEGPELATEGDFSMIYYPAIFSDTVLPNDSIRCAEHADYEIMTLLFQKIGGLEVKMSDGSWASADPIPDSIVVNTGDMLGIWTNQYYPATVHRVVIPKSEEDRQKPRYTMAYFVAPDKNASLAPLNSKYVPKLENKGEALTSHEHRMHRMDTAYAK